jgi:hypothetical protein
MRRIAVVLAVVSIWTAATPSVAAQKDQTSKTPIWSNGVTSDSRQIEMLLAGVPLKGTDMPYANLGERLTKLGIRVTRIDAGLVSSDDVKLDPGLRLGDVDYRIYATEPTSIVNQLCPLTNAFNVVRRGKIWIPRDRTSNFLMNGYGHCRPPG